MVKICNEPYPSNSKYDSHFELYPYPLSDFQKYAIEAIVEKQHVLVTAHTGSGKTLPAEFAIQHFAKQGKKVVYTSPIKALSNQKYYEFTKKFPEISFGLFTGDIKTNPDADVLIMTTEILMNYLFTSTTNADDSESQNALQFQIDVQNDLACVVFDEVHYINDADRGQTWEKTILMLPRHIQMVMLSATIDNPQGFAKWCEKDDTEPDAKCVYLASTNHRVVPLSHYGFLTTSEAVYKTIRDKETQKEIRDNTNKLIPLQDASGTFNEVNSKKITKINGLFDKNRIRINRKHALNKLASFLKEKEMLPAIAFVFSRKNVEACAHDITVPLNEFDSKVGYTVRNECEQIIRKLPNYKEYLELPEYNRLVSLLEKGIGIHHSGMIPILREIVELMISKRYIKLLFATESFAIGLDCPIKTAVFTSLTKFDGHTQRFLLAHEYTQMAGRAGRRGIDTVGHVVHCNNLFDTPMLSDYKLILGGKPQQLVSKYHISYSLILNLIKNGQNKDFHLFSQKSMVQQEIVKSLSGTQTEIDETEQLIVDKEKFIQTSKTPRDVCETYIKTQDDMRTATNKKRKQFERDIRNMEDEYKYIKDDASKIYYLLELKEKVDNLKHALNCTEAYVKKQTDSICDIMCENGFIIRNPDDTFVLTLLGNIASNIAEIHPMILSELMVKWNNFENFDPIQLVGLFSCFTDVKVPDDTRLHVFNIHDTFLDSKIKSISQQYDRYHDLEQHYQLNTGLNYTDPLIYDMIEFSMHWCECTTEQECKSFIQNDVYNKSISIGDFTKAMLKIVTISKEFMNVCEQLNLVELQHKLSQIEGLVLKYITTSQSLYV
jgi:superfamily II RNA helicase